MLFSRLPRPGTIVEAIVLIAIASWIIQNPASAGHLVGVVFHFAVHMLPAKASAFVSAI